MYKMSQTKRQESSYLEIIVGPMFSGKTSKLLEVYKQCKFCNIPVVVINYAEDNRYHNTMLSTHDKVMIPCIQTTLLESVYFQPNENDSDYEKIMEQHKSIHEADVLLINEAQFFPDLKEIVLNMLNNNKKVYVSGLDGDFKREKFGTILDLIPYCDKVTKLTSLCGVCKDGTPGIFSLRLTSENEQKVIGSENYIPVCRNCYDFRPLQIMS